jgi:hypothetical protein
VSDLYSPGWDEGGEDFLDERDYGQALIVAAYKFAGVPDPERLAAAFLARPGDGHQDGRRADGLALLS